MSCKAGIDRQLWEIDENLIRSELTATQQAEHLAKRKELWGMRNVAGRIPPTKPQHEKGFAHETECQTGVSKRRINEAISRAEGVTEEARDAIRGTDLDTRALCSTN
ncbi:MAG: hypothetical protein AAF329_18355 [Cyanobacteria bacterium P01_A01_bin.17]